MEMLNSRMPEVLETLERERMVIEVIFREHRDGEEYLYWFSIQREGGAAVESSPHEVDRAHLRMWDLCIDEGFPEGVCRPQVVMVPHHVAEALGWQDPPSAARPDGP